MDTPLLEEMTLSNKEYASLISQSLNYRVILRFLKAGGLDEYLREHKLPPIDLVVTPDDTIGGESITLFLKAIADECNLMDKKIQSLSEALVDSTILLTKEKRKIIPRTPFLQKIKSKFTQLNNYLINS